MIIFDYFFINTRTMNENEMAIVLLHKLLKQEIFLHKICFDDNIWLNNI